MVQVVRFLGLTTKVFRRVSLAVQRVVPNVGLRCGTERRCWLCTVYGANGTRRASHLAAFEIPGMGRCIVTMAALDTFCPYPFNRTLTNGRSCPRKSHTLCNSHTTLDSSKAAGKHAGSYARPNCPRDPRFACLALLPLTISLERSQASIPRLANRSPVVRSFTTRI